MFIGGPLVSFLMRETVVFYARWAWEHQGWCVWSMRSSHQGSHLFVWVLLWHNSSWNAIWVWAFLSRHTKAKERMNRKINDHFTFHSTVYISASLKNKPDKDKSQKSKSELHYKTNRRIKKRRTCLHLGRMDISSTTLIAGLWECAGLFRVCATSCVHAAERTSFSTGSLMATAMKR